jgi:RNA polymerase sigma-70 factor (ECF subfamily)
MEDFAKSPELPSGRVAEWVTQARGGSAAAIGQILELCRQYLLLVANRELDEELRGKEGASDLVQQTFLEAHRDFGQFHGTTQAEILGWLRRILLNNLGNVRRRYVETGKRQIGRELPLEGNGPGVALTQSLALDSSSPSSRAAANEEAAALDRALNRLPPDYQEVILLRHEQGLSFGEVGELMDRSAEAARKLWTRAICQLREELEGR